MTVPSPAEKAASEREVGEPVSSRPVTNQSVYICGPCYGDHCGECFGCDCPHPPLDDDTYDPTCSGCVSGINPWHRHP